MKVYTVKSWKEIPEKIRFHTGYLQKVGDYYCLEDWKNGKCTRYMLPRFMTSLFEYMKEKGKKETIQNLKEMLGIKG